MSAETLTYGCQRCGRQVTIELPPATVEGMAALSGYGLKQRPNFCDLCDQEHEPRLTTREKAAIEGIAAGKCTRDRPEVLKSWTDYLERLAKGSRARRRLALQIAELRNATGKKAKDEESRW